MGSKRLLNGARLLSLAIHDASRSARSDLKSPRVVHGDRNVIAQRLQNSQLLTRETVHLRMRCGEHSHQSLAHAQRNGHFGQCRRLASDVVLILADIGRIAHLTGRGDVADHAFAADFQAMSFALRAAFDASADAGQHHLGVFFVMQVDAGLQAAERIAPLR